MASSHLGWQVGALFALFGDGSGSSGLFEAAVLVGAVLATHCAPLTVQRSVGVRAVQVAVQVPPPPAVLCSLLSF